MSKHPLGSYPIQKYDGTGQLVTVQVPANRATRRSLIYGGGAGWGKTWRQQQKAKRK